MIPVKEKACKGQGKAKGYGCGIITKYRKYGLCKAKCYPNWLLNSEAGKIELEKARLKVTKPRMELEALKKEKTNRKGLTTLLESVKQVCHKYIRLRDNGKPCISCGTQWHDDFQAGHYFKAELYSNLRFNEHNINSQCVQCNIREEGNLNGYSLNLPNRIGQWKFDVLTSEAEHYKKMNFKWDRDELMRLRNYYKNKIKELQKGNS